MADTFTAFLNMTLPEIGASDDTWGDKVNDNFDILDALFGTTGEGTVVVRDTADDALVSGINLTKAAGNARLLKIKSGTSLRWDFGADATAEGGSNAGSVFKINRYTDAGSALGTPFQIDRASGLVTFETTPKVGTNEIWHAGNDTTLRTPVGVLVPYIGTTAPSSKWLMPYGQTFVDAAYPELAALCGTAFNTGGEGAGNTRLPDLRGYVIACLDNMGGTDANRLTLAGIINALTRGNSGGEKSHLLTLLETVAHTHLASGTFPQTQVLSSDVATGALAPNASSTQTGVDTVNQSGSTYSVGQFTSMFVPERPVTVTVQNAGGGGAHNNIQPTIVFNYLIRALP